MKFDITQIFYIFSLLIFSFDAHAIKNIRWPDFNTDVLYESLQPCNEYIGQHISLPTQKKSLHSILSQSFKKTSPHLIPDIIQHHTINIATMMAHAYIDQHAQVPHTIPPRNIALSITLIMRMLQDISETYSDHQKPLICAYITQNDLIPLAALAHALTHILHYQKVELHIIPTDASSKSFAQALDHFKTHHDHVQGTITTFKHPYDYLEWGQHNHIAIDTLTMIDLEPLNLISTEIPEVNSTPFTISMNQSERFSLYKQLANIPIDKNDNVVILQFPKAEHRDISYVMIRPHTPNTSALLYVNQQPSSAHSKRANATYKSFCDPYVAFEDIAQALLAPHGIAYSTQATPSGIQYLQRYNVTRELQRMKEGKGIPTARTILQKNNLTQLWPYHPQQVFKKGQKKPLRKTTKQAISRSQKK